MVSYHKKIGSDLIDFLKILSQASTDCGVFLRRQFCNIPSKPSCISYANRKIEMMHLNILQSHYF